MTPEVKMNMRATVYRLLKKTLQTSDKWMYFDACTLRFYPITRKMVPYFLTVREEQSCKTNYPLFLRILADVAYVEGHAIKDAQSLFLQHAEGVLFEPGQAQQFLKEKGHDLALDIETLLEQLS